MQQKRFFLKMVWLNLIESELPFPTCVGIMFFYFKIDSLYSEPVVKRKTTSVLLQNTKALSISSLVPLKYHSFPPCSLVSPSAPFFLKKVFVNCPNCQPNGIDFAIVSGL